MKKPIKFIGLPAWQIALAAAYAGFALLLVPEILSLAKWFSVAHTYPDPTSDRYAMGMAVIVLFALVTQVWMVVAILRSSRQVRLISRFDLLAGAVRTLTVIVIAWLVLRQYLPVYFFAEDACGCMYPRPDTEYIPLDQYKYLIFYVVAALSYAMLAVLPLWFFNRSKLAQKTFTK